MLLIKMVGTIQAPACVCAHSVLGVAATVCQTHHKVNTPHGDEYPLSLALFSILNSGERKSSCDKICKAGLEIVQENSMQDYLQKLNEYEADLKVFKVEERLILKNGDLSAIDRAIELKALITPAPPLYPRWLLDNITVEGIHKHFETSHPSAGMISDEAGLFIGGHAMLQENQLKTLSTLTKLWGDSSLDRIRGGDGSSTIKGRVLSTHMMAQGIVADQLLANDLASGQGFLPRQLITKPTTMVGRRKYASVDLKNTKEIKNFTQTVIEIAEKPIAPKPEARAELNRQLIKLTPDAAVKFAQYVYQIESLNGPNKMMEPIGAFAIRMPEHALRLAAVILSFESRAKPGNMTSEDLQRGLELANWYSVELLRIREQAVQSADVPLAELLLDFIRQAAPHNGARYLISRDVLQYGPNKLRERGTLHRVIALLEKAGHLEQNDKGKPLPDRSGNMANRLESWKLIEISEATT